MLMITLYIPQFKNWKKENIFYVAIFKKLQSGFMKTICDALHNLIPFVQLKKNVKKTHGRVLLLVKLQPLAYNTAKSNSSPWVFFTFFKFRKWYQTTQNITVLNQGKCHFIYLRRNTENETSVFRNKIMKNNQEQKILGIIK